MKHRVAIVGAGVSGLTCGVLFAERGYRTAIFARDTGQQTTSGAAAALWFPYDAEPAQKLIPWALDSYRALVNLRALEKFRFHIGRFRWMRGRFLLLSCRAESRHLLIEGLRNSPAASR